MSFDCAKPSCASLEKRPGCIQAALYILGDKWSPLLLGQLIEGEKTFGDLEIALVGISPRTLSQRLGRLEAEEIIQKRQYCKHPPRYKYLLTKKGEDLQLVLQQMANWGDKYHSSKIK
jgi:DNA-binding HxlR family transcriptional regulator